MGRKALLFPGRWWVVFALLAALLVPTWAADVAAEDALAALRTDFQRQKDPVKRAKLFPKLGNALLAEMRRQIHEKEFDRVPALFTEYHDGAKSCLQGLEASGRDADKQPGGYRELEMHLRQSRHVVNDIVFALPLEERDALLGPQRDLEQMDEKLVKALFPSKPEGAKTPPSTAQSHPQI